MEETTLRYVSRLHFLCPAAVSLYNRRPGIKLRCSQCCLYQKTQKKCGDRRPHTAAVSHLSDHDTLRENRLPNEKKVECSQTCFGDTAHLEAVRMLRLLSEASHTPPIAP